MPSDANHRYDSVAPIPSYDEAIAATSSTGRASSSRTALEAGNLPRSSTDEASTPEFEARSLLRTHQRSSSTGTDPEGAANSPVRSRRNNGGYRQPTVETDDEDSLWSLDSDTGGDEEAAHVRREMQELDMDDDASSGRSISSIFGKRIPFSLSLPQWRWRWRWHLPRLRIQLPNANAGPPAAAEEPTAGAGAGAGSAGADGEGVAQQQQEQPPQGGWWRSRLPAFNATAALLILGRTLAIVLVLGFLYLIFMSDMFGSMRRMIDPEAVRQYVQGHVDPHRIRQQLRHFTGYAHLAGSEGDYALAVDVKNMFENYKLEDVTVEEFWTYVNYPVAGGRAVEILDAAGATAQSLLIEEEEVGGEKAGRETFVFQAHSKSGDVKGPLVYANYGSREDFKRLYDSGIDTKGAIALVRHYGPQPDAGLKVKAAELAGFAGCIVYSDPADDGFLRGEPAPEGRFMPADGVQRGAVSLSSLVMGDPLTPGWESIKENPRLEPHQSAGLVKIPSLPLAWRSAQQLLKALRGHGQRVPDEWVGGVPDVAEWWTGNLSSPVVRLKNQNDEVAKKEIWNVYGRIAGHEQSAKSIMIGNRRDSLAFGASGPHSGTAIMMEMARIFGSLRQQGWQPMRTIDFMSWDGGEYNNMGSAEFVEKNLDDVRANGLAYINLDEAVTGSAFRPAGSPVFRRLLHQVLHRVADPATNETLRDMWEQRGAEIEGFGSRSDYVAFQDLAGTASLDLRFAPPDDDKDAPTQLHPPRGSSYDTFDWMDRHGDPGFVRHALLGQVLALMIVELSDRPVLPFDMEGYAADLQRRADDFVAWSGDKGANRDGSPAPFDVLALRDAANVVSAGARHFARWELSWEDSVLAGGGYEPLMLGRQRMAYNSRMGDFDTHLLDIEDMDGGVPNRTQFKHVVFGPKLWASHEPGYFPAIRDAVEAGDWLLANKTLEKAVRLMKDAGARLVE